MSTETPLLGGWTVTHDAGCAAPVAMAASVLERFGANVIEVEGQGGLELSLRTADGGPVCTAGLAGWRGESALGRRPAVGAVLTAYAGLRLAGAAALAAARGIGARLPARELVAEVSAPLALRAGRGPELLRCRDGWIVVRWREDGEPALLRSLVGRVEDCPRQDVVAAARLARMLAAPVRAPARTPASLPVHLDGQPGLRRRRARVLDWTVLWAGPWATAQLRRGGARVDRVEHPRRRDGLLDFPAGRRCWRALNAEKRTRLLDARRPVDHQALERGMRAADIVVTSMTPRALHGLGFDDAWRLEHAPHLLHLELVAFDDPWVDAPGLGEHAAAQAGLLWRGQVRRPAEPEPWADPLLGAAALAVARIWQASGRRRGGRIRVSLEQAAALALEADATIPTAVSPASSSRR